MSVEILIPAESYDLTLLSRVKSDLQIPDSDTSRDPWISEVITNVSAWVSDYCSRTFAREKVVELLPGNNRRRLVLTRTPIVSIESIFYGTSLVDPGSYLLEDRRSGFVYARSGWTTSQSPFGIALSGEDPELGQLVYQVTYTGGYYLPSFTAGQSGAKSPQDFAMPGSLELIVRRLLVSEFRRRGRDLGIESYSVGDFSISYLPPDEAAPLVKQLDMFQTVPV